MGGGLFGSAPKPKPPPVPPPPPTPEVGPEAEEQAAMRAKKRKGFAKTIITGALEPAGGGKRTLLG